MAVKIKKVTRRSDMRRFIKFPEKLYEGNEYWVPALEGDEYDTFNPKKNGAYEYCEADCFLAYKDDRIAGRVAAIINRNANRDWNENTVRFGWLDFIEDEEVVRALLDCVKDWGRQRGCDTLKGPLGFTDMDKEGLLVEGFDRLCPFTCLYNYPYYDTLLQKVGLEKETDWTQKLLHMPEEQPKMYRLTESIENRYGIHVYKARSMKEIADRYGMEIFHTYNETFAPLFQFSPLTDRQISSYLKTYVPILNPDFVSVCIDKDDRPVGFAFVVPSLSKAVRKAKGRLFPFGFIHILKALKKNDTLEALMIGVLPEYQGKGAHVLLLKHIHDNAIKYGINRMILNPQLEDNFKAQNLFEQYTYEPYMRRRAYSMKIG